MARLTRHIRWWAFDQPDAAFKTGRTRRCTAKNCTTKVRNRFSECGFCGGTGRERMYSQLVEMGL